MEPLPLVDPQYHPSHRELEAGLLPPKSSLAYVSGGNSSSSNTDYSASPYRRSSVSSLGQTSSGAPTSLAGSAAGGIAATTVTTATASAATDQQIYSSPPYGSHSTVISIPANGRPGMYSSYHGATEFSHATESKAPTVNLRIYPEVSYNMQLAPSGGSGESGYHGGYDNPSSSSNSTNPRTPSRNPLGHRRTSSGISNTSVGSANVNSAAAFDTRDVPLTGSHMAPPHMR